MALEVDSASNRNEHQESSWGQRERLNYYVLEFTHPKVIANNLHRQLLDPSHLTEMYSLKLAKTKLRGF
jgi:hypothetical protein